MTSNNATAETNDALILGDPIFESIGMITGESPGGTPDAKGRSLFHGERYISWRKYNSNRD
jgi:hypothetical protein